MCNSSMNGIELQIIFLLFSTGSNARSLNTDSFCGGQETNDDTEKLGELHLDVVRVWLDLF